MSGSPPPPLRRPLEFENRGQESSGPNDALRGMRSGQPDERNQQIRPSQMLYQRELPMAGPFSYPPRDASTAPGPFQQILAPSHQQQQQPPHQSQLQTSAGQPPVPQMYPAGPSAAPSSIQRPPSVEVPPYSSPKTQRKTKGHVASACVPCKRAHLRCDAQRPCSRCLSNGKEDSCFDMQHKKRGRPRLRDERDTRYESIGPAFPASQSEPSRRPPVYSHSDAQRPGYRPVTSHGIPAIPGRYQEMSSMGENTYYSSQLAPAMQSTSSQEAPYAFLNMDFQVLRATVAFSERVASNPAARRLHDMVQVKDVDKLYRLQRDIEAERNQREPNYLPPISMFGTADQQRVVQSVVITPDDVRRLNSERHHETLTFVGSDGHPRPYSVRLSLCKKESTYFVILMLVLPATSSYLPGPSPYQQSQSQYGYQPPQPGAILTPVTSPYVQPYSNPYETRPEPSAAYSQGSYAQGPSSNIPMYAQQSRPSYQSQPQGNDQTPRSETAGHSTIRQHDLQLPPIRSQPAPADPVSRIDRSGRVDIGGLLEQPKNDQGRPDRRYS